jgi:hypothetical protein
MTAQPLSGPLLVIGGYEPRATIVPQQTGSGGESRANWRSDAHSPIYRGNAIEPALPKLTVIDPLTCALRVRWSPLPLIDSRRQEFGGWPHQQHPAPPAAVISHHERHHDASPRFPGISVSSDTTRATSL